MMDVDTERVVTDDERMTVDYEEEEVDVDGDAMMDDHENDEVMLDDEGGEGEAGGDDMEAEPTSSQLDDTQPFFSTPSVQEQPVTFPIVSATTKPLSPVGADDGGETIIDDIVKESGEEIVGSDPLTNGETLSTSTPVHPLETAANPVQHPPPVISIDHAIPTGQPSHEIHTNEDHEDPTEHTEAEADPENMPSGKVDKQQDEAEEEYYEGEEDTAEDVGDGDDGDNDYDFPHDVHTLPPIILNLPGLGARTLFAPLPEVHNQGKLPVWLSGKLEELGEASLSDVWAAVRVDLARERLVQPGEMVIVQKQMDLNMGEDDINLQSITLLELLQLHHSCGLVPPVQLHITFSPSRFGARFYAIQKEVNAQEERRKSEVLPFVAKDDVSEDGGEDEYDEEEENEEEEVEVEEREVDGKINRKPKQEESVPPRRERIGDDARAEYGGSRRDGGRERAAPPESDHPNADWAQSRLIHPVHMEGSRIIVARTTQESEPVVVAPPPQASRKLPERKVADEDDDDDIVGEDVGNAEKNNDDKDTADTATEDNEFNMGQYASAENSGIQQNDLDDIVTSAATERIRKTPMPDNDTYDDVEDKSEVNTDADEFFASREVNKVPRDEVALLHEKQDFLASVPPPATPLTSVAQTPLITSAANTPPVSATPSVAEARTAVKLDRLPEATEESTRGPRPTEEDEGYMSDETPLDETETAGAVDAVDEAADEEVKAAVKIGDAAAEIQQQRAELEAKESALDQKDAELDIRENVEKAHEGVENARLELQQAYSEKALADAEAAELSGQAEAAETAETGGENEVEYDYDDDDGEEYNEGAQGEDDYGVSAIANKGVKDSLEDESATLPPTPADSTTQELSYPDSDEDQPSPTATIDDDTPVVSVEDTENIDATIDPTTRTTYTDLDPLDTRSDTNHDLLSPVKRSFVDDEDEIETVSSKRARGKDL